MKRRGLVKLYSWPQKRPRARAPDFIFLLHSLHLPRVGLLGTFAGAGYTLCYLGGKKEINGHHHIVWADLGKDLNYVLKKQRYSVGRGK